MKTPFLLITPPLALGILTGQTAGLSMWWGVALVMAAVAVYAGILARSASPSKAVRYMYTHWIWMVMLFGGIGIIARDALQPSDEGIDRLKGTVNAIVRRVDTHTSGDRLVLEVGNTMAVVRSDAVAVSEGDIVELPADFRKLTDNPNRFDQAPVRALREQGIFYESDIPGNRIVRIADGEGLRWRIARVRNRLETGIEKTGLESDTKRFLISILLGSREYVTPDMRNLFADAGIAHLLALSGMHIAIVAALILALLFPLNLIGCYKWRYPITVILLWFYTFMTGMAPSTVRASLMATFCFLALVLERPRSSLNALLGAAGIILLFDPSSLFNVGAQLSFLSVGALILFVGPLNVIDRKRHSRTHTVVSSILTAMVATGATWPVVAYYFRQLPMMFLPVNLVVLPLLPVYIGISLVYFALEAGGVTSECLAWLIDAGYHGLTGMCAWASQDGATVLHPHVPAGSVWTWLIALGGFSLGMNNPRPRHRAGIFCSSGLCALLALVGIYPGIPGLRGNNDGLIVQNMLKDINVLTRVDERETLHVLPRRTVSSLNKIGKKIVSIDRRLEDLPELESACNYLILGSGYQGDVSDAVRHVKCDTLVIHSSVRKKREQIWIEQAQELGIPVHSLRRKGPLRYHR